MATHSKISLSFPLALLIKVDVEREKTNLSRSGWVKDAIEAKLALEEETREGGNSSKNLSFKI